MFNKKNFSFQRVTLRGEMSSFLMLVPDYIGRLESIDIWLDGSGLGNNSNWFLQKIIIVDPKNKQW